MEIGTDKPEILDLKKHINAIHCTNNLTLVQRKLFNALLFNAYRDLPYKTQFEISSKDLCKLIGYNSNDYKNLKKAILGLITTAIEWNVLDDEKENKWSASSILSAAKLAEGSCVYEYSSLMKELFFRPDVYGRLNMAIMSKFKSSYGLALYENCIRFQGLPQTPWFPIDVFRKLMGVQNRMYCVFSDFKKRVIDAAVDEVNLYSSISLEPEILRRNQKVKSIRFKMFAKVLVENNNNSVVNNIDQNILLELETIFLLSKDAIKKIYNKYEEDFIIEKIKVVKNSLSYKSGKIKGLSAYFIDALKNNYMPSKAEKNAVEKNKKTEMDNSNSDHFNKEKIRREQNAQILKKFNNLDQSEQLKILNDFSVSLGGSMYKDVFIRDGLSNILIQEQLCLFIRGSYPQLAQEIIQCDSQVGVN
jgi:plasmid replication initiation protein